MLRLNLRLQWCRFTGSLPKSWASKNVFTKLKRFSLRNNKLSGSLPNVWNLPLSWRSLTHFDLSNNEFVGE